MLLRFAPAGEGGPQNSGLFPSLLAEAARRLGGVYEAETEHGFIGRFRSADGSVRPIFGKALGLNSDAAAALAADKHYTARLLRAEGVPAPSGELAFSPAWRDRMRLINRAVADRAGGIDRAVGFASKARFPVIVKPNIGYGGRGVRLSHDPVALAADLAAGFKDDDILRVEPWLPGRDYRILILDGKVILAYERSPLAVTGDGCRTIAECLDAVLADLECARGGSKLRPDDHRIAETLAMQGLTLGSVPAESATVRLLSNANLSTGGQMHDLTGALPEAAGQLAVRAAKTVGLRVAGVDILAPDLLLNTAGAHVLEVNSAPGLDVYASSGPSQRERTVAFLTRALAL